MNVYFYPQPFIPEDIDWEVSWSGGSEDLVCGQYETISDWEGEDEGEKDADSGSSLPDIPLIPSVHPSPSSSGDDFLPELHFTPSPPPRPAQPEVPQPEVLQPEVPPSSPRRRTQFLHRPTRPRSAGAIRDGPLNVGGRRGGPYSQADPRLYQLVGVSRR